MANIMTVYDFNIHDISIHGNDLTFPEYSGLSNRAGNFGTGHGYNIGQDGKYEYKCINPSAIICIHVYIYQFIFYSTK